MNDLSAVLSDETVLYFVDLIQFQVANTTLSVKFKLQMELRNTYVVVSGIFYYSNLFERKNLSCNTIKAHLQASCISKLRMN